MLPVILKRKCSLQNILQSIYIYIYIYTWKINLLKIALIFVQKYARKAVMMKFLYLYFCMCSPMVRVTWVQSQIASYHRLKKWYLIPPCLTLSNIREVSRAKWSNPGKGVAPSPTPRCSSYWKRSLLVTLDYGRQLIFACIDQSALMHSTLRFFEICRWQYLTCHANLEGSNPKIIFKSFPS